MVCQLLPYKDIPNEWIEDKFGIPTLDKPAGFGMYGAPPAGMAELLSLFDKVSSQLPGNKAGELRAALIKLLGSLPATAPQGGRDFFT